ncbi:serine/threonine-protein phosphatase 6 regulatory ankyrin repeat subunit C-like isoform X2 [Phymastichus coffea]|uniref:serine/threonine-protein phosphatase 6 regulatory ankyrin repeat subunit C-like isoform X2 n=1 Tax=Phymastichus coffea TaxID=108790 RepID=UPI00273BCED2|nr:serine/threonine-protein phosphatase 6 regulatory ankyrin repeat subunit C-like isoform X2 [Phymastichus coffea]
MNIAGCCNGIPCGRNVRVVSREEEIATLKNAILGKEKGRVIALLEQNPDLNCREGGLLVWDAIMSNQIDTASRLIDAGADLTVNHPSDGFDSTFLHVLVKSNDRRCHRLAAKIMERNGVDINARDRFHVTVLHRALEGRYPINIIKELLRHQVDVTGTPVVRATIHDKSTDLLELLVNSFLELGTANERVEELLLRCGSASFCDADVVPLVKILLLKRIPATEIDQLHFVVIHAVRSEKYLMVKLLINYGFNVNAPASPLPLPDHFHYIGDKVTGETPLGAAAKKNYADMSLLLLQAGAIVNAPTQNLRYGRSYPIHCACEVASVNNIRVLLRHGADVNLTDNQGRTPFSRIVYHRRTTDSHRVFLKHFARLVKRNVAVNESDMTFVRNHEDMQLFYDSCINELEKMETK